MPTVRSVAVSDETFYKGKLYPVQHVVKAGFACSAAVLCGQGACKYVVVVGEHVSNAAGTNPTLQFTCCCACGTALSAAHEATGGGGYYPGGPWKALYKTGANKKLFGVVGGACCPSFDLDVWYIVTDE